MEIFEEKLIEDNLKNKMSEYQSVAKVLPQDALMKTITSRIRLGLQSLLGRREAKRR